MHDARTYAQALEAIEARGRYGIRLGLGRVRALLRAMGDPELAVRGALVAGTNGKGSVIALAGSALRAAGYRVGETPKPHLVTYRERIVVDGRPIAAADFARLVDEALPAADRIARRLGPPTEFELLTAVMFRHFAEVDLDVALVEVGLGGRLDATNAWDGGVAVLTNVGLDHTDRLGPTIAHIAREKAAIVKRGDVAVTGADGEALAILRTAVRAAGRPPRRGAAGRRSSAGRGTPSRWSCRAWVRWTWGSAAATRPPTRRSRTGCWMRSRRRGSPRCPRRRGAGATRPRAGRGAWSWSRRGCRAPARHARSSSTAPTTRTGPAPSRRRSTTSARTSPAVARPPRLR